MKRFMGLLGFLFAFGFAQGGISGILYANDVQGFMVIGCLLDLTVNDCDYDRSPYVEITQSGQSFPFVLENAPEGNYLVVAWKDTNGNGTLEDDGSDELTYLTDANGDPVVVTPPAADIVLEVSSLSASSDLSPVQNQGVTTELVGIWQAGLGGAYDPSSGDWGFGDSAATDVGHWYQLNADGSYQSRFGMNVVSFGTCRQKILIAEVGTYTLQNGVLTLTATSAKKKSDDNCDDDPGKNYLSDAPLLVTYKQVRFLSEGLELTSLKPNAQGELSVDQEDSTPIVLRRENP